jgi:hypothetical protein
MRGTTMAHSHKESRRDFLKTTAAGTAGIALSTAAVSNALNLTSPSGGWHAGLKINPSVQDFIVVSCYDEAMVGNKIASSFATQNESVDTPLVEANMDTMATKLTGVASAASAWGVLFRKPSAKSWNQVTVAIKVNCYNILNMPRIAIVGKVCKELIRLGVPAANITIFDACSSAWGVGKYTSNTGKPVTGLPADAVIWNKTLDGPQVPVGTGTLQCTSLIAQENGDHTIGYVADIIVNCAVNNGHSDIYGGFTMCMKNHIGTLKYSCPSPQELIDINQCEAIIGKGTADIPCRQQLCIVDSLWASDMPRPDGQVNKYPCRIVMGTLAPMVDYLTAEKVRKVVMKTTYNTTVVNSWLSAFGYKPTDPSWIEITPSTSISSKHAPTAQRATLVKVSLTRGSHADTEVLLAMPDRNLPIVIELFDLRGSRVRRFVLPPSTDHTVSVAWNGLRSSGRKASAGRYTVQCSMGGIVKRAVLSVTE